MKYSERKSISARAAIVDEAMYRAFFLPLAVLFAHQLLNPAQQQPQQQYYPRPEQQFPLAPHPVGLAGKAPVRGYLVRREREGYHGRGEGEEGEEVNYPP